MAVLASIKDNSGAVRKLYVRLNNFDNLSNHGVPAEARFRGFTSQKAFEAGAAFTWEAVVPFVPDLSEPIWPQAYAALTSYDFAAVAQLASGGLMAMSFAKENDLALAQQALDDAARAAEQNGKRDDPQVKATAERMTSAIDAIKADKQRLEDEIAAGLAEVERLRAVTAAFAAARPA